MKLKWLVVPLLFVTTGVFATPVLNIPKGTINNFTCTQETVTEGNGPASSPATGVDVEWADSTSHWPMFNPNNVGNYEYVGTSPGNVTGNCVKWFGPYAIGDAGAVCGGGGITPGATNYAQINPASQQAGEVSVSTVAASSMSATTAYISNLYGSGSGPATMTANGLTGPIIISTTTNTVGHSVVLNSTWTIGDSGYPVLSGVTASTYGSATVVPVLTVNAAGQVTAVSSATITASGNSGGSLVNSATQYYTPAYSAAGGSTTLSGYGDFQNNGSTITIASTATVISNVSTVVQTNVSTVTASGVYFDTTGSTFTTILTSTITSTMASIIDQNSTVPNILPNNPLPISCNAANASCQANIQNQSATWDASSDYIATSNNGTNTSYYADFGINSSSYSDSNFSITPSSWAYLYSSNAGLAIGSGQAGTDSTADLVFFTSGAVTANERFRIKILPNNNYGIIASTGMQINAPVVIVSSLTVSGVGGLSVTQGISASTAVIPTIGNAGSTTTFNGGIISNATTASRYAFWDASKQLVSTATVTSTNITGVLPTATMPALTGDITTTAGAVATTAAATQANITTLSHVGVTISAGYFQLYSRTAAQIKAFTPSAVGQVYQCSDCATVPACISTGTALGAFSILTSNTSACQ